ncbi:glycosyltransferase family 4 protein [Novosphingobium profundi]|uniref:glycosyltransferase family 4 protein n=1 Tax=Novosphingobium profundi TaxID=1774954 RepID=UPI001BDA8ABA|nr:glycosyltransferase family 4 protein [Novosphingobium profundi]MBT0668707.1 glycosyltransferase family 4 protein [Novosphingobium profundi]
MTSPDPLAALDGAPVWVMAKGYAPDEGGMQTYAQGVAEAYARAGARVTVFTQTSAGPREETLGAARLVDIGAGKSPMVPLRLLKALGAKRRSEGAPAFLHATTWRTSVVPMLLGLPYITTFHGREFMYPAGIALRLMRRVARRARGILAVSHYSAMRLSERLGPDASAPLVAWNGLSQEPDPDAPLPVKHSARHEGVPLIFTLCRLEPRKNVAAAVRACARVRGEGASFRYVIGGRGPELERIRALVADLGLEDCVEVAGFMPTARVEQLYREADIFLHPQIEADGGRDFEGFGIAIADAMVTASAVVAGIDGGTRELIEDEVHGLAVDGHDEEAIARALSRLVTDAPFRESLGAAAHARTLREFTWKRHIFRIAERFPVASTSQAGNQL